MPQLDRTSKVPAYRQLSAALRHAVAIGSLRAGARLPSTRSLAAQLGVARSTVATVFEQIAAEGYIESRQGSGFFVAPPLAPAAASGFDRKGDATARATSRYAKSLRRVMPEWRNSPHPFEMGMPRSIAGSLRAGSGSLQGPCQGGHGSTGITAIHGGSRLCAGR